MTFSGQITCFLVIILLFQALNINHRLRDLQEHFVDAWSLQPISQKKAVTATLHHVTSDCVSGVRGRATDLPFARPLISIFLVLSSSLFIKVGV